MRTVLTVRLLQALAVVAGLALLFWSLGLPSSLPFAEAANLTNVSNTLSDSDPSALSDHVIQFTVPVGSDGINASGEQIVVTFPNNFDFTADGDGTVDFNDVDLNIATNDQTIVDGLAPAANQWGFDLTGQVLTLESGGGTAVAAASEVVIITVGEAAAGGAANSQVTNPVATGSSEFLIDVAGGQDTGRTRVVVIENVDVTARVDTNFEFTITGVGGAETVNGTTTTGTTSATAIPFGTLTAGNATTSAQDLTVTTNANQGFSVTVVADQELMSSTGATINNFVDGSDTAIPTAWASPSPVLGNTDTYGHWGITSDDATTTRATEFGSDEWVAVSTSTPVIVMGNTGPADGSTAGVGTTRVGYQVEITNFQEAGDDYTTTLTYVATPTF